jgi:hypothetical protein
MDSPRQPQAFEVKNINSLHTFLSQGKKYNESLHPTVSTPRPRRLSFPLGIQIIKAKEVDLCGK